MGVDEAEVTGRREGDYWPAYKTRIKRIWGQPIKPIIPSEPLADKGQLKKRAAYKRPINSLTQPINSLYLPHPPIS